MGDFIKESMSKYRLRRLPEANVEDEETIDYMKAYFSDDNITRVRRLEKMAQNHHYAILGRQWIELDTDVLLDGARGYVFREKANDNRLPHPVTNMIAPAVEVELTSLNKRQLIPNVIPLSHDPRIEAAADVSKDVLEYRLRILDWPTLRSAVTYSTILYGTGILKSYWDETYSQTTTIANPEAMQCPSCSTKLASPFVPEKPFEGEIKHRDKSAVSEDREMLTHCPTCDEPNNLVAATLSDEDLDQDDMFGRKLGMEVPKGNTMLEVVSPFDFFPENSGIGDSKDSRMWGQATVRSLDWIQERYPWAFEDEDPVEPEDPLELLKKHPVYGDWDYVGNYDMTVDTNIYDYHARVFELYAEKSYRFPNGRAIVMVGKKILYNGDLYRTVNGRSVPIVKYGVANFKMRPGEFFGRSLVDDLISPQNRLNGIDAQIVEARERLGSPNIMATEGMYLNGPEWDERGGGAIYTYQVDPLNTAAKPEFFGDKLFNTAVYQERDRILQDMKALSGPQDIEIGEAPKNITTTSGLQLLGESAERRRGERERNLVTMFEKIWVHQLELLNALRVEPDEYELETQDGIWEINQFTGQDLMGQTKLKIEKQADVDKSLWQREATREAQVDQLYQLNSPQAIRRILELRGLPTDVNEDQNFQIDCTKRQWVDFQDQRIIPIVDASIDDPAIHFHGLATFLLSEEGQRFQKAVGWNDLIPVIAGWEQELQQLEMLDATSRQVYGGPDGAQQKYVELMGQYQLAQNEADAAVNAAAAAGQPVPMNQLQPPPEPFFLPQYRPERIYQLWIQKIQKMGGVQLDQLTQQQLDLFLRFRSVVETYRLMRDEAAMALQMPAPGTPEGTPGVGNATDSLAVPKPPNPPNPPTVGAN